LTQARQFDICEALILPVAALDFSCPILSHGEIRIEQILL